MLKDATSVEAKIKNVNKEATRYGQTENPNENPKGHFENSRMPSIEAASSVGLPIRLPLLRFHQLSSGSRIATKKDQGAGEGKKKMIEMKKKKRNCSSHFLVGYP